MKNFPRISLHAFVSGLALLFGCLTPFAGKAADELATNTIPSRLHWIWSSGTAGTGVFEKDFSLSKVPANARIKVTSTKGCKVFVNGTEVAANAELNRPVGVDVKKNLVQGENKIRVEATAGANPDAILLTMLIADPDGTRRRLDSNDAWQAIVNGKGEAAREIHPYETSPFGDVFAVLRPSVTKAEDITVPAGFKAELLHALDEDEGSWVAMCVDPKGRLIASDAGGRMVRITPPAPGGDPSATKIEPIPVVLGHANGLLWAFDSLYVTVCQEGVYETGSGIYRVRDTNGDDVLDEVELLRKLHGSGDHGPHALMLSPDGKSITVVCGNSTRPTEWQHYQVPPIWKDDLALPKINGHGFMSGSGAPAGYFSRMSPDGQEWTLIGQGLRNQYDAAYNRDGELFTYDADMEWDLGTPWYRPTRVCHIVDGAEYGWRSVSGKWPEDYADSLPPVLNVGKGSPTGVAFGYGAKFPSRYQEALFIADWTYGRLYAVHLKEDGATYSGSMEVFLEGRALKPTDIVINPEDGALYFGAGSRNSNSALYRVSYTGTDSVTESVPEGEAKARELRELRHRLEAAYHATDEASLALALENLDHPDRFIRFAARTLLEFRPVADWEKRALALTDAQSAIQTSLALARLEHTAAKEALFQRLEDLALEKLTPGTRLDAIRALQLASIRLGDPEGAIRDSLLDKLHAAMPATDNRFNVEAAQLLVRWKSPLAAREIFPLFQKAPTQEEQIAFAASLRFVAEGWPPGARETYFGWFLREEFNRAGNLAKFITDIRKDAVDSLSPQELTALEPVLNAPPEVRPAPPVASRLFVKNWTTDELIVQVEPLLKTPRNLERGKALFRETGCIACHLFKGEGGAVGPDLTLSGSKFGVRELIESMTDPGRTISDQYGTTQVTLRDGSIFMGRKVNEGPDLVQLQENVFVPSDVRDFSRKEILKIEQSAVSMMPPGLANTCHPDEVADLIAWLQAGAK